MKAKNKMKKEGEKQKIFAQTKKQLPQKREHKKRKQQENRKTGRRRSTTKQIQAKHRIHKTQK